MPQSTSARFPPVDHFANYSRAHKPASVRRTPTLVPYTPTTQISMARASSRSHTKSKKMKRGVSSTIHPANNQHVYRTRSQKKFLGDKNASTKDEPPPTNKTKAEIHQLLDGPLLASRGKSTKINNHASTTTGRITRSTKRKNNASSVSSSNQPSALMRRRKMFKTAPRVVHFVPLDKKPQRRSGPNRSSSSNSPVTLVSPDAMKRITRRMHLVDRAKIISRPHAPRNTSSDLIDQYKKRLELDDSLVPMKTGSDSQGSQEEQELEETECRIKSCFEGIDTFGTFDLLCRHLMT